MKVLYYDCFSGISGDMNLGALLDLGIQSNYLLENLDKLNLSKEFRLEISKEMKKGVSGTKVKVIDLNNVRLNKIKRPAMLRNIAYKGHHHKHVHTHEHSEGHHNHLNMRNYKEILKIIKSSSLNENVKLISEKIFFEVAKAEAKVHGKTIEEVHFHEVGAIDSIVDIVGCAICIDYLNIDKIMSSPIEVGYGTLKCAHGIMPVPAPATTEILKGLPIISENVPFEATTPTGAAIIKALAHEVTYKKNFNIMSIAYGLGEKDNPNMANALRVILGETDEKRDSEFLLECNIDDMRPEEYELLMERLFDFGALDVYYTNILMKKGRPSIKLSILCKDRDREVLKEIIFKNSSTIGIREIEIKRDKLLRKIKEIDTEFGKVSLKISFLNGEKIRVKPEYDICKKIAIENNLSVNEVYNKILATYNKEK